MKFMSKKTLWIFIATLLIYVFTQKMRLAKRLVFGTSFTSDQKCLNNYQIRLQLMIESPEHEDVGLIAPQMGVGTVFLTYC